MRFMVATIRAKILDGNGSLGMSAWNVKITLSHYAMYNLNVKMQFWTVLMLLSKHGDLPWRCYAICTIYLLVAMPQTFGEFFIHPFKRILHLFQIVEVLNNSGNICLISVWCESQNTHSVPVSFHIHDQSFITVIRLQLYNSLRACQAIEGFW